MSFQLNYDAAQYRLDVLTKIKDSLVEANEKHDAISDTIWVTGDGAETLFDYIDHEIELCHKILENSV